MGELESEILSLTVCLCLTLVTFAPVAVLCSCQKGVSTAAVHESVHGSMPTVTAWRDNLLPKASQYGLFVSLHLYRFSHPIFD